MTSLRLVLLVVMFALAGTGAAVAQAQDGSTLTVLPWNGAFLRFAGSQAQADVALDAVIRDEVRVHVDVAAPLNETSHQAKFSDFSKPTPGTSFSLWVAYDYAHATLLAQGKDDQTMRQICAGVPAEDRPNGECTPEMVNTWLRKTLSRDVIPATGYFTSILGLTASGSYDVVSGVRGDLAAATAQIPSYNVAVGAKALLMWPAHWALTLTAGYQLSKQPSASSAARCQTVPSSDPTISGSVCDQVGVIVADPGAASSMYAGATGTYLARTALGQAAAGAELHLGMENVGQGAVAEARGILFFYPLNAPVLAGLTSRFGVGVDALRAVSSQGAASADGSRTSVRPFAVVGASF